MIMLTTQTQRNALKQVLILLKQAHDNSAVTEETKGKIETLLAIALGSFRR